MAKLTYLGAVSKEQAGFSIVFLDVPGAASCGDTLEEVLAMGKEALEGHIEVSIDYGDTVPAPTEHALVDVERWLQDDDEDGPLAAEFIGLFPIEVDVPSRTETVPVRVKADLVRRIADLGRVTAREIDSGRFIEEAVEHEIERYRKSAA